MVIVRGQYEGTIEVLNRQLFDYLRNRRCALAIEARGDRWAAIIKKTVRPWVSEGPSPNDFAIISGELFKDWDERLTVRHEETLTIKSTLPEAQAYLDEWVKSP